MSVFPFSWRSVLFRAVDDSVCNTCQQREVNVSASIAEALHTS